VLNLRVMTVSAICGGGGDDDDGGGGDDDDDDDDVACKAVSGTKL
jgi:hypothetical protein